MRVSLRGARVALGRAAHVAGRALWGRRQACAQVRRGMALRYGSVSASTLLRPHVLLP